MPKVDRNLLDKATQELIGSMNYINSYDRTKWLEVRKYIGISRGQWKRMQQNIRKEDSFNLCASKASIKKLELIAKHGKHPHLHTLLKMIEVNNDNSV